MRTLPAIAAIALLLTGCESTRRAIGSLQGVADKGIVVGTAAATEDAAPASAAAPGKTKGNLPASLGGDHENHAYTTPPKRG